MEKSDTRSGLFESTDYRKILQSELKARGGGPWGAITRLAEAVGCQRSHLSRVLKGQKELTPEQALAIAQHLSFSDPETEYFMALVDLERAGTQALRSRLRAKIQSLRREQEDLGQRLRQPSIHEWSEAGVYYSAWFWSAVHVLTSIPDFQNAEAMAQRLSLPKPLVEFALQELARLGLVKKEKKGWAYASGSLHLPKSSPLLPMHLQNWRARAVLDAQSPATDGLHYTIVQSLSQADFEKVKALLLRTIDQYTAIALPSEPQELVQFSCDFHRV